MAVASVSWVGTRIDASDSGSTVSSIGGGAGAGGEPDIVYQGTGATPEETSRKVGTSAGGFAVTTAGTDISTSTGTYQTLVMKYSAANSAALETLATPGMQARLGSSGTAYASYDFAGSDAYPEKGGFVFLCVDPNITGYRTGTTGSPNLASASYWGIVGDFTATSKSENLVHSAVDVGNGYTVTGGGGADPTATYQDVADYNSTLANRHGFFFALEGNEGAYGQYGKITWGSSATAVDYQDTTAPTVFFLDGYFAAGWSGIEDNLENASTVINPVGGTFISRGNTTTTDTRAVYNVVGSAATGTKKRTSQKFENFAEFNAGATMEYDDCDIQSADFTHNTATLTNCTLRSTAAVNVAMVDDLTLADVTGLTAVQEGAGHFVDLGTISSSTSISWDVTLSGFPTGTTGDPATTTSNGNEAILVSVNSGQKLTINVSGAGTVPSVKNDGLGDVAIVSSVPVSVTVTAGGSPVEGAAVYLKTSGGTEVLNGLTNSSGVLSGSFGGVTPATIDDTVSGVKSASGSTPYQYFTLGGSITSSGFTATALLSED